MERERDETHLVQLILLRENFVVHREHRRNGKRIGFDLTRPDHGDVLDARQDASEARCATRDDLDPSNPGERPYRDESIAHDPCFLRDALGGPVVSTRIHEDVAEHRVGRARIRASVRVPCQPIKAHLCRFVDLVLPTVGQEQLPRDVLDVFRAVW